MNDDDCGALRKRAVDAGLAEMERAKGRSICVLNMRTGVIKVIPEDVPGHCDIALEEDHDFCRWLVRKKIAIKGSRGRVLISDRSRTGLAVASEMVAIALASELDHASVPVVGVEPSRHL